MKRSSILLRSLVLSSGIALLPSVAQAGVTWTESDNSSSWDDSTATDTWTDETDSVGGGDLNVECSNENGSCWGNADVDGKYYLFCYCGSGAQKDLYGESASDGITDWNSFQNFCEATIPTICEPYYHVASDCMDDWGSCSVQAREDMYSDSKYVRDVGCGCRNGNGFSYTDYPTEEISANEVRAQCKSELRACRNDDAEGSGISAYPANEQVGSNVSCNNLYGSCWLSQSPNGGDNLSCYCGDGQSIYLNGDLGWDGANASELLGECQGEVSACHENFGDDDDDTSTTTGTSTSTTSNDDEENEDDNHNDTTLQDIFDAFGCSVAPSSPNGLFGTLASLGLVAWFRRRRS